MKYEIKKLIKDCLTEGDGTSYCAIRVAFWLSLFTFLGGTITAVVLNPTHAFDHIAVAGGLGALLTTGGAGIAIKGINGNASNQ